MYPSLGTSGLVDYSLIVNNSLVPVVLVANLDLLLQ